MNGYTYPPHQQSPQHQQPPSANQNHPAINPGMLQGAHAHVQQQGQMHGMPGMSQAQLLARQQMINIGTMNGMTNMGMPNGAMNMAMSNRMNGLAGMNMGGMGMNSMGSMNNMDLFKQGTVGTGAMNMNLDSGMTINPAMLGPASTNSNGGAGMSTQDLQKMMVARQATLGMGGMNGMNSMNNINNMGGLGAMGGMNGMNMGMNVMGGNAQQQVAMQQYLAQQQAQQQQQQQSQSQIHSPHSSTHTPASATGGNPYPPFASQSQSQMQGQIANVHAMAPPPPRPNTAMSGSSQHGLGMGIVRPPSALHHQQQQALHNQQQQQQQMGHGPISRPGTASGFRSSSSAGEAPRTPRTPQLSHQHSQSLNTLQGTSQGQHMREPSHPPSRPQTAGSNHGAGQGGMNGKYPLGMGGMGGTGMNNMANISNMGNMGNMGGMPLMGGAGGGMMPPPTLPRQSSLGPSSQNQSSMQPQPQSMQSQQQQMQHHHQQQQQSMMSAHGHSSPISASAPPSTALARTPSIGEGLGGMGAVMGGPGMDDPMGNMSGINSSLGMGPAMGNAGMASGMGMGIGMGGIGGIGVGGIGGMSQMQHMQEMQQRKAITLAEYHKQQAARLQQQQHQQQQHQGQVPNVAPAIPSPGASIPSAGMNAAIGSETQNMHMAQSQVSSNPISIQSSGMNIGMATMGTPTRAPVVGRASMPPPGSAAMSMGGVAPLPGTNSGVSAGAVAPPATTASGSSVPSSINGAIPPAPAAANATATSTAGTSAPNALTASLPPLPAGVQLNPALTRITAIPISESATKIPPLAPEEIKEVAGWLATDLAYEVRFRDMVSRAKAELAAGPVGVQRPRWWERDPNPTAAAAARRGKVEKFDLHYPHGAPQSREAAAAAARRKGRRREGLKIPGRLKAADAERGEQLVPIRLEFDVEHHKYRDTFVWNINDPIVTPEAFAQSLIDDYGLSTSYHSTITKSIQEQLSDYKAHSATLADVSNDIDVSAVGSDATAPLIRGLLEDEDADAKWWAGWRRHLRNRDGRVRTRALLQEAAAGSERTKKRRRCAPAEGSGKPAEEARPPAADSSVDVDMLEAGEDDMHEEMRIVVKLDITVGEMKLDDQFEWDIENPEPTPEQFAEVYCSDLGLAGEFKTAISHAIREQVNTYQKSLFLVGHPSDGSAVQDDDLRMSFLFSVTSVSRSVDQTQAHQPIINYLSDGELERLDKDREKEANKRRKRNTRGRRGITLPDREPLRTHRTPAIGFPEIDPSMLALAAAAAAPTSRRAAAAAASLTIANMVASENGTTIIPQVSAMPSAPALPTSKIPKARGSFKAPSYPSSVLKPRANVTSATPSTVADTATFEPPLEGDMPLPASTPATPSAPPSKASQVVMTARRQRELEKEAKEREFADGQRANIIDGVWHCSNCGCPDSVAIGRRKGPLGDKSQCGACGKFWHRHRRPRPVEYHTDPEYHINLKMETERAKASAKKRGGAAALRALNIQQSQDQAATPASMTDEPSSPAVPKNEVWVEIKSPKKPLVRASPPPADVLDLLDRPLSPASDASSSASERPLAQSVLQANGTGSASRPTSAAATPFKSPSELPAQPEPSTSAPAAPASELNLTRLEKDSSPSEPPSAGATLVTPTLDPSSTQGTPPPRPVRPQWQEDAMAEMQARYPDDRFDIILRKQNNGNPPEWRVKCLDCPGKLYTPGPGETLSNFEVHLKNRQHRAKVHVRLHGSVTQP